MKYFIIISKELFKISEVIKGELSKAFKLLKDVLPKSLKSKLKSSAEKILMSLKFLNESKIIKTSTFNLNVFLN